MSFESSRASIPHTIINNHTPTLPSSSKGLDRSINPMGREAGALVDDVHMQSAQSITHTHTAPPPPPLLALRILLLCITHIPIEIDARTDLILAACRAARSRPGRASVVMKLLIAPRVSCHYLVVWQ